MFQRVASTAWIILPLLVVWVGVRRPHEAPKLSENAGGVEAIKDHKPNTAAAINDEDKTSAGSVIEEQADEMLKASSEVVTSLSAADLAVQTDRWLGQIVSVEMNCFYADVGEFRCVSDGARVDLSMIRPEPIEDALQRDCASIRSATASRCRRTIRFLYAGYSQLPVGRFDSVTLVEAANGVAVSLDDYPGKGRTLYRTRSSVKQTGNETNK